MLSDRSREAYGFLQTIADGRRSQHIAEYAVLLAMILVLAVGTTRAIGTIANTVFSRAASSIQ